MGDFENPLLNTECTNFSSRLVGVVYWTLWAVALSTMVAASVGAIVWAVVIFSDSR